MPKTLKNAIFLLFIVVFTAFITLSLSRTLTQPKSISLSAGVVQRFEKTGKLQVITFYMDQILDETEKKSLLWVDEFFPDTQVLISVKSEVSACVDLSQITEEGIENNIDQVILTLPQPEFCNDPNIDLDSVTRHLERGFGASDLQITALQNGKELAKNQAIENQIFELAKDQAEVMIKGLLAEITDKEIVIRFAGDEENSSVTEE